MPQINKTHHFRSQQAKDLSKHSFSTNFAKTLMSNMPRFPLPSQHYLLCLLCLLALASKPTFALDSPTAEGQVAHVQSKSEERVTAAAMVIALRTVTPTIVVESGSLEPFLAETGNEQIQFYTVYFDNFPPGQSAFINLDTPTGPFSISTDEFSGYSSTLEIKPNGDGALEPTNIFVKYKPTEGTTHTALISHSSAGAETVTISVNGELLTKPLPVEVVSFKANSHQSAIIFEWTATNDEDFSHFALEASSDPKSGFSTVGLVYPSDYTYTTSSDYSFAYYAADTVGWKYFRLALHHYSLSTAYSPTLAVEVKPLTETQLVASPSPFTSSFRLIAIASAPGKMAVSLYSSQGVIIYSKVHDMEIGENDLGLLMLRDQPPGNYVLRTELKGAVNTLKLVKL